MSVRIVNDFIPVQSPSPYHPDARRIDCITPKCKFSGIAIDDEGADHMMKCHARIHGVNVVEDDWRGTFVAFDSPIGEPSQ